MPGANNTNAALPSLSMSCDMHMVAVGNGLIVLVIKAVQIVLATRVVRHVWPTTSVDGVLMTITRLSACVLEATL